MSQWKLALVQFNSILKDPEKNLDKASEYIKQAAQGRADIIVFPELFTTGYNPDLIGRDFFRFAHKINGSAFNFLARTAREVSINIIAPLVFTLDDPQTIYNGAFIINRKGELVGTYAKNHLWKKEALFFTPGSDLPIFKLDDIPFGILICYDGGFPEAARALAIRGAKIIFAPSAFDKNDSHLWDIYFPARSSENGCFTVGINRTGREGDIIFFGKNKVVNPVGHLVFEGRDNSEELQLVTINLEEVEQARERFPFLRDLRPDLYSG